MKKIIISIILAILLITISCIGATANNEPKIQTMTFVHYAKGQVTYNIGDETEDRYKLMPRGLKWPSSFQYQVDHTNLNNDHISDSEAMAILEVSLNTWQSVISNYIFEDPIVGTAGNVISWESLSSGIIAQNTIHYNRITGDIIESDVTFNTYYSWGDATIDPDVMDLQNIAVHEFGHNGLRDLYDPHSTALTMYGYSAAGDTNKRTLGHGDVLGIQSLYGSNPSGNIELFDIDSSITSPTGNYRWMDIASQLYADTYRVDGYDYTQATIDVGYNTYGSNLIGTLTATNLKPNFAYQLKLVGGGSHTENHDINERIGLTGRWWMETWDGTAWTGGTNLNSKGDGSSPNPNDVIYFDNRNVPDTSSPTGYQCKFTGYLIFDYFITDENGDAIISFSQDSSYHVLWKGLPGTGDGPVITSTFDPDTASPAYDFDYGEQTVSIFGEWERLPADEIFLPTGFYTAQLMITEESFHETEEHSGNWAAAMGNDIQFTII